MKLILGNKEYELYDSIGELTIEQFRDITLFRELYQRGEFTEIELITEVASTITGIPPDDLMKLELNSFNEIYVQILELLKQDYYSFVDLTEFQIEDKWYKMDTKLDIMPLGMWIDVNELSKSKDFWENAPKLFASLIRKYEPKTKKILKYDINDVQNNTEIFSSKLKLKHFMPCYNFFLTFWEELQKRNSVNYSQQAKRRKN